MILQCTIFCECDKCGEEESFEVNTDSNGVFSENELKRALAGSEWTMQSAIEGKQMLCGNCVAEADQEGLE